MGTRFVWRRICKVIAGRLGAAPGVVPGVTNFLKTSSIFILPLELVEVLVVISR